MNKGIKYKEEISVTRKELIEELQKHGNDDTRVVDHYDDDDTDFDEVSFDEETSCIRLHVKF